MLHEPIQQRDGRIVFRHQRMAQAMGQGQHAQRADRVGKQGVRPVERVDVSIAVARTAPASRLHGAAGFEGQFIQLALPGVVPKAAFEHQPPQIAVGADIVEPVVMHTDVRHVRSHPADRVRTSQLQNRSSPVASNCKIAEPN